MKSSRKSRGKFTREYNQTFGHGWGGAMFGSESGIHGPWAAGYGCSDSYGRGSGNSSYGNLPQEYDTYEA